MCPNVKKTLFFTLVLYFKPKSRLKYVRYKIFEKMAWGYKLALTENHKFDTIYNQL